MSFMVDRMAAEAGDGSSPLLAKDARNGAPSALGGTSDQDLTTEGTEAHRESHSTSPRTNASGATCFESLPVHSFPASSSSGFTTEGTEDHGGDQNELVEEDPWEAREAERVRRVYRSRTVGMLRRYMQVSIETGRLPSVLGREFFRAKVTSYRVGTFEDRVIFVHDMEICLERLDEFSRQLIARHVLQEHDQEATARLLHCGERTVRTYVPVALDLLSEILLEVGLMERLDGGLKKVYEKSCQGGPEGEKFVSDCEESENKF